MESPETIKHYRLLSRLGEGGMGVVYRAQDGRLGRTVALKTLRADLARNDEFVRRFEREALIASAISHPGIATLYDFDREGETAFLTMEWVEGRSLRELLAEGPLALEQALDCAVQVAEALAAAHRSGVIHRDLKPENVMAAESGYYKILDFGVARWEGKPRAQGEAGTQVDTLSKVTRAGSLVGTVAYMSPEQALGEKLDPRSDIFSFGSLLYEMVTGRQAFRGANDIATAQAIVEGRRERLRESRPEAPRGLELVVDKCLARDPAARYPTADALAEDLRILRSDSLTSGTRRQRLLAYREDATRRRVKWAALSTLGAALITAGFLLVPRLLPGPPPPFAGPPEAPRPAAPGAPLPAADRGVPRLVVAYFTNHTGDPEAEWLSRGLPEMLTTDLASAGGIEVIATQRLYDLQALANPDQPASLDRTTATELARWAGATVVISGSVFRSGARYRIDAQAYDTRTGEVLVARKVEGTELLALVGELTAELRDGLEPPERPRPKGAPPVMTASEEALRHYAEGKALYARLRYDAAAEAFRRALVADPQFDLARLRLAMSLYESGRPDEATELFGEAARRADRLPQAERMLALAADAFFVRGDFEQGARHLDELRRLVPGDREALIWSAHALATLENEPLRAVLQLRQVLERDPDNLQAVGALATQLADLGAVEDARAIVSESLRRHPEAREGLARLTESLR